MNKEKLVKIIKNTAAVVVMLSLFVIIFYQNRDRDFFKFGKNENSSVVTSAQTYSSTDAYLKSDAQRIGDKVAYITPSSFSVLNKNAQGDSYTVALSNPVLHTEGNYAVFYDEEALTAFVYKNNRQCYSITSENKIIKAKVNRNGYLFISTEKEGYNCECMIFNQNGEAIFKWDISKSEFIDGDINCANNTIALSVATAESQRLLGEIVFIDITDAKEIKRNTFESQLFFNINFYKDDTCAAFGTSALAYFNSDGTKKWSYDYSGKELIKADISEPDMMVLAFSETQGGVPGGSTDVKIINRLGKAVSEKIYDSSLDDIALSDSAVAMSFGKTVIVADSSLNEKKTFESESSIEKIALYNDNKHLFVIGSTESKILE